MFAIKVIIAEFCSMIEAEETANFLCQAKVYCQRFVSGQVANGQSSGFISVAVIKCLHKKQFRGEDVLAHNSRLYSTSVGSHSSKSLAHHIDRQEQRQRNALMPLACQFSCHILCCRVVWIELCEFPHKPHCPEEIVLNFDGLMVGLKAGLEKMQALPTKTSGYSYSIPLTIQEQTHRQFKYKFRSKCLSYNAVRFLL